MVVAAAAAAVVVVMMHGERPVRLSVVSLYTATTVGGWGRTDNETRLPAVASTVERVAVLTITSVVVAGGRCKQLWGSSSSSISDRT